MSERPPSIPPAAGSTASLPPQASGFSPLHSHVGFSGPGGTWGPSEAALFEALVVPRFANRFAEPLLDLLVATEEAQVVHLGCRTGYLDDVLLARLPNAFLYGADSSEAALEVARAKKRGRGENDGGEYLLWRDGPSPFGASAFSHAVSVLPESRERMMLEARRLLAPSGQFLLSCPLRGSYIEPFDLLREYAIKHDDHEFLRILESALVRFPTPETLTEELTRAGFSYVEVELRRSTVVFASHEEFLEDPSTRLFFRPIVAALAASSNRPGLMTTLWSYLRNAISRYFRDEPFELTVSVGIASARR
jgi:SAM-dependent methyltransferase